MNILKNIFAKKENLLNFDDYSSYGLLKSKMAQYENEAKALFTAKTANNLYISANGYQTKTIKKITEYVNKICPSGDKKPLLIIDYLQILSPSENQGNRTDKQNVDSIVKELKNMQVQLEIPVIAICSVNRESYFRPIDPSSLKESGSLEFSADVIWALEPEIIHSFSEGDNLETRRYRIAKQEAIDAKDKKRNVRLSCLKNRYGTKNYHCNFTYYPKLELFEEYTSETPYTAVGSTKGIYQEENSEI